MSKCKRKREDMISLYFVSSYFELPVSQNVSISLHKLPYFNMACFLTEFYKFTVHFIQERRRCLEQGENDFNWIKCQHDDSVCVCIFEYLL